MEESIMPLKRDAKLPLAGQTIDLGQLFEDIELYVGDTLILTRSYTLEIMRHGYTARRAMMKDIAVRAKVVERPKKDKLDKIEIDENLELK